MTALLGLIPFGDGMMTYWIAALVLMALLAVGELENAKKMKGLVGRTLVLEVNAVIILDEKKEIFEEHTLQVVNQIELKFQPALHGDSLRAMWQELCGKTKRNRIRLMKGNGSRTYEFEIPSHYMLVQLNKVTEAWKNLGIEVSVYDSPFEKVVVATD